MSKNIFVGSLAWGTTSEGIEQAFARFGVVTSAKVMTGLTSQLSVAVAVPVATGAEGSSQLSVISAGHVITGAVISWTVTV